MRQQEPGRTQAEANQWVKDFMTQSGVKEEMRRAQSPIPPSVLQHLRQFDQSQTVQKMSLNGSRWSGAEDFVLDLIHHTPQVELTTNHIKRGWFRFTWRFTLHGARSSVEYVATQINQAIDAYNQAIDAYNAIGED